MYKKRVPIDATSKSKLFIVCLTTSEDVVEDNESSIDNQHSRVQNYLFLWERLQSWSVSLLHR